MLNFDLLSQSQHFLALPRPDVTLGPLPRGLTDTTTLAAHDFDVDNRTGFMPPEPPLGRLPSEWETWEATLDSALAKRLKLYNGPTTTGYDRAESAAWRESVRKLPVLSIDKLNTSEVWLRRAHQVLAWIVQYYIHTHAEDDRPVIPRGITIPLLRVCQQLLLPPIITYSDNVLYNWALIRPRTPPPEQMGFEALLFPLSASSTASAPALDNLKCLMTFTGTRDEEEFYLSSARIEFRGVEALELMRETMDEAFVGDNTALRRITSYLQKLFAVIKDLAQLLAGIRQGCDPEFFYDQIRPWLKGQDSCPAAIEWVFEGIDEDPTFIQPTELSGPSAGQSSLISALDIFLGVSHDKDPTSEQWLRRMRMYMPRHHRNFLRHLENNPRPLKALVEANRDHPGLLDAFNASVESLKELRDTHVRIVAIYIAGPARRATERHGQTGAGGVKGTGGTHAMSFVKSTRNNTTASKLS
ncbi:Indoleamine 2,3-dioxygenase [Thelephora ganbajun]|uniref:Indoleamine 2,3-dioxygenase n=1 Tax=Thelephora ganbajun TaxID=370292 RepID=A0ACB6Z2M5_THEGA|nr:Indoleamine 2,3-dioxygenase [Thelephora ganbajun]